VLLGTFELGGIPPQPRGVPRIEVSLDIDANGILNVSAEDKGTGKKNQITITADKGRLSKEDIERMLQEAEKYKEEDQAGRDRIEARNNLESYLYNMKNSVVNNSEVKLDEAEKKDIHDTVDEGLKWLEANESAGKDEFKAKYDEVSGRLNPILAKMYGGMEGMAAAAASGAGGAPTVEEVD
jgi:L1 cell adhesion molecule like protein